MRTSTRDRARMNKNPLVTNYFLNFLNRFTMIFYFSELISCSEFDFVHVLRRF